MGRLKTRLRNIFVSTSLGKKIRYKRQISSFKEQNARKIAEDFYKDLRGEELDSIVSDMMTEAKEHNVKFEEYTMYHFDKRSYAERRAFIPSNERVIYCERFNKSKNKSVFDDKAKTYKYFGKYFKRDLIEIISWNKVSVDKFERFIEKHPKFIVKPHDGASGVGIRIIDSQMYGGLAGTLKELKSAYPGNLILEELIIQQSEVAVLHPSSVNTLRICTVRFDDHVELLPGVYRIGRGGACVDNGGSGGIFSGLDDDGIIVANSDELGRSYEVHPDTAVRLIGFQVPRYEEAKQLAAELAQIVPDNRYCGWDLALTEDGWIMQEGNWQGGFVAFQCAFQRGFREEMDDFLRRLKL